MFSYSVFSPEQEQFVGAFTDKSLADHRAFALNKANKNSGEKERVIIREVETIEQ